MSGNDCCLSGKEAVEGDFLGDQSDQPCSNCCACCRLISTNSGNSTSLSGAVRRFAIDANHFR